jgi:hypothetical protein
MTRYMCMFLATVVLAACEKKTETVTPPASPTPSSEMTTSSATSESPATESTATTESPSTETSSPTP